MNSVDLDTGSLQFITSSVDFALYLTDILEYKD